MRQAHLREDEKDLVLKDKRSHVGGLSVPEKHPEETKALASL